MNLTRSKPRKLEKFTRYSMLLCALVAVFTTLGILASVSFESIIFFSEYSIFDFLFGTKWSPQNAFNADIKEGAFGIIPLILGTFLITLVAMCVAVPISLLSAIYLSQFASSTFRSIAKPIMEILAAIPTVVYGFIAIFFLSPAIAELGRMIGLKVSYESALAAGVVMGIMIIPFISSLSDDALHSVPSSLKDGSLGIGATKYETVIKVVFPAALPGIIASIILGFSRAIGETMIVVMAAGLSANLSFNPLDAVTTITVQIVTALTGDQEFDSLATLSAFALGLFLFIVTFILNMIALRIVKKYREEY